MDYTKIRTYEANHILLSADKFLSQNEVILSKEEIDTTQTLTNKLKTSIEGTDKDAINKAIQDLNEYTSPLAHRSMDKNIAEAMKGKEI